jgi:hypothetical protein
LINLHAEAGGDHLAATPIDARNLKPDPIFQIVACGACRCEIVVGSGPGVGPSDSYQAAHPVDARETDGASSKFCCVNLIGPGAPNVVVGHYPTHLRLQNIVATLKFE